MERLHHYSVAIKWTGNTGQGTQNYGSYYRSHDIQSPGKPVIAASSDPSFSGDKNRYNPEELFLAALSSCHMLWYLHLCAEAGIVVTDYQDVAKGIMTEDKTGAGRFTEVVLYPHVTVASPEMVEKAQALHHEANTRCYIANSCNFPVQHQPKIIVDDYAGSSFH